MCFNRDKCVALRLYSRQAKDSNHQYQLNEERLRSVIHQRELGVIVDKALKPHHQCAKAARSANSIVRAIRVLFMNITSTLFDKLYETSI